jgi:hypothetical protein
MELINWRKTDSNPYSLQSHDDRDVAFFSPGASFWQWSGTPF